MHHGTSIMRYFYHKALETDPGADPSAFRHHGVKPVRKEMAILMLSDACEASVRSLIQEEDPSTDNIAKLVDQVVAEKLEDGQLDESSLTFGELTKVKQALVDALIGYYHTRVSYPGFPGSA
jgi:membrane-associated HD superfamily phosphohydrolase